MLIGENVDGSRNSEDVSDPYATVVYINVYIFNLQSWVRLISEIFDVNENSKDVSDPYVTVDICADGKRSCPCLQ